MTLQPDPNLPRVRVLLVEDDEDDYIITRDFLNDIKHEQFDLDWVANFSEAREAISRQQHDVYLIDYRLGEDNGLVLLREAVANGCQAPIILLTGLGGREVDNEAIASGAADYLVKGQFDSAVLERSLRHSLQRKKVETRLRESEEQYRLLFERNVQPMWVVDSKTLAFLEVNDAAIQHYGFSREEFLNMTLKNIRPEDDETRFLDYHKEIAKAAVPIGRSPDGIWRHRKKDGGLIDVEITWSRISFQGRDASLVLANDITERRRAERNLEQQLTRISLLNHITHAVAERQDLKSIFNVVLSQLEEYLPIQFGCLSMFDPQASSLNVAALRLKNPRTSDSGDLRESSVIDLEHPGLRACLEGGTVYFSNLTDAESSVVAKLAQHELRSAVAVPMMVDNKLFSVLLVARRKPDGFSTEERDFLRMLCDQVALAAHQARLYTELQHAYDELRLTQQSVMQHERLRALGQMTSGIAHDINNALSPVVGFAELLLTKEANLSETAKKYLHHIQTASEDVTHIVSRLREFYRRREEAQPMHPVKLNQLVRQVIDLTRPRWRDIPQQRGLVVEMQTELDPDLPDVVGIESELREALTNLVLNSVDAMPSGGTINIRTQSGARDYAGADEKLPSHVILEVKDTGVGMDEETRKRCLEPFFSTKGLRGTGLGLAMVYGVVERHEGSIEIDSLPGKGTTMRLIFPLRETPKVGAVATPEAGGALAQLRVLFIDDEPLLRELLKEVLEADGHKVQVADGGQSGLDAFRAARERGEPFHVVITDLGMPYVDGRQVAQTIKRESPTTPVLMLTGWGAFMKAEDTLAALVDGVLSKPPKMSELYESLAKVVSKYGINR